MPEAIITVDHVSFAYEEKGEEAVRDVSLSIPRGAFYAILGQNGSGKSTLAKLMNGLYTPSAGRVTVCGMDTQEEKNTWSIREKAGMVFQNPDNQLVATMVREDVAFGLENIGVPTAEMPARIERALADVGMQAFADRAPHTLSGGQKQRVAIAGVLAMRPEAIIFDESTAMLDPQGRREVLSAVRRLNQEQGITVLWITHFMEEAAQCQTICIMPAGNIVLEGAPGNFPGCAGPAALSPGRAAHGPAGPAAAGGGHAPAPGYPDGRRNGAGGGAAVEITLEHVSHTYQPGSPFQAAALCDVSLTIRRGDFLALIGHTGSGKSTLAQHINGLLRPTAGRVLLDGQDIEEKGFSKKQLRQRVGLVFQYPEHQLFEETVAKDVAFGPRNLGLSAQETADRVREALERVGLPYDEIAEKSPFELSGGQMRRAAMAGVLAMRPEMLVLDEPAAGLDPQSREEMLQMIARLHAQGDGIVMISHSMDDVARYATRAVVMEKGRAVMEGTPAQVFRQAERLEEMGLEVPAVCRMGRALRAAGVPFPEDIFREDDAFSALLALWKDGKKHA